MKKIISVFLCALFVLITISILPVSASTTIDTIEIYNLKSPQVKTSPEEYITWTVNIGCGYYIQNEYNGLKAGLYYMEGSTTKEVLNFTESDEYVYILPIGFNSGYSVAEDTQVVLCDSDTPFKVEASVNTETNTLCAYITYKVTAPNAPKVTFNANGGNVGGNESIEMTTDKNGYLTDSPQLPTRDGYALDGWYTLAEGGNKIITETYKFLDDTTVYAHWIEAENKVELTNVTLPMPGRAPVFTALVPDEASYAIEWEMWEDDVTGQLLYSDEEMNDALDSSSKITSFALNCKYTYKVKIRPSSNSAIAPNAELFINGEKKSYMISGGAICVGFQAKEPTTLTVYDAKTIYVPMGVVGDSVSISVSDYAGGIGEATFTLSGNVPDWLSANQSDWTIKGVRNSTEIGPYTFTVNVTDGTNSGEIEFRILKTEATPVISGHPVDKTIPCGGSATLRVKHIGESTATYKWKVAMPGTDTWFDASAAGLTVSGADTDTLTVSSAKIYDYMKFKCEVTIYGNTLTSNEANVYVNHTITSSLPLNVYGSISMEKHSSMCSVCNELLEMPHKKKWIHRTYPSASGIGNKIWQCTDCGTESSPHTYNVSDQVSAMCYFYDNYDNKAPVGKNTYINAYDSFESMFPSREGYVFAGWALSPDAKSPDYVRGEKILIGEEGMCFYAVWAQPSVSIGGVVVYGGDVVDVFDDETAVYNSKTGTLTLNNAYYSARDIKALMNTSAIYAKDFLEIKLIGDNYLDSYYENSFGIEVDGTLLISGEGSLDFSDSGVEIPLKNAIKADKVFFVGGHTYIKDSEIAVNSDAYFMGGICETYLGIYNPTTTAPYVAYTGEITCKREYSYCGSESLNGEDLATEWSPYALDKNAYYTMIAPGKGEKLIHYNNDRNSIMMLYEFEEVDLYTASYASADVLLRAKVFKDATPFTEYPVDDGPDVSGVKVFFWKNGTLVPELKPEMIGTIE